MIKKGKYKKISFEVENISKKKFRVKYFRRKTEYTFDSYNVLAFHLLDSENEILKTESCKQFYSEIKKNIDIIEHFKYLEHLELY